jgi:hypothetical protein
MKRCKITSPGVNAKSHKQMSLTSIFNRWQS